MPKTMSTRRLQFVMLFMKAFWYKRRRRPVVMLLEVVWPAFLFSVVIAVRSGSPPVKRPGCYYNPRAMPSAGPVDFLQTHICGINNRCLKEEPLVKPWKDSNASSTVAHSAQGQSSGSKINPIPSFSLTDTAGEADKVLPVLPKILKLIDQVKVSFQYPGISNYLQGERGVSLGQLSKDPDSVTQYLIDNKIVPPDLAERFVNSSIRFGGDGLIPELKELFDLKGFVCDANRLGQLLKLPPQYATQVKPISQELCSLNHTMVPAFTDELTQNINASGIIQYVTSTLEKASAYTQDNLFSDLRLVTVGLRDMQTLEPVFEGIPPLRRLPEILDNIQGLLQRGNDRNTVSNIMKHVGPLIGNVLGDGQLGEDIADITEGIESISNFIRENTKDKEFFFGNLLDSEFLAATSLEQLLGVSPEPLFTSRVDSFQLREIAMQVTLGNDFTDLTCTTPRLSRVLRSPSPQALDIVNRICALDRDVIDDRIQILFNYPTMLRRADDAQRSTLNFLDWVRIGVDMVKTVRASISLGQRMAAVIKDFKEKTSNLGQVLHDAFSKPFEIDDSAEFDVVDGLDIATNIIRRVPELKGLASGVSFTRQIVASASNDFIEIKAVVQNPLALLQVAATNPVILDKILDAFASSSVDINKLFNLVTGDNTDIVATICTGTTLTSVFKIPEVPGINVEDVAGTLCGSGRDDLTTIIRQLDLNKVFATTLSNILPSYMLYGDWWDRSIDDVIGIIDGIGTVMDIASGDRVFDARVFLKLFYHFIANMGMGGRSDLANGVPSILAIIKERVVEPDYFVTDIEQFANKLLRLSIFYREIPLQGTLQNFLKEPAELQMFLKDTLDLTPVVADAVVRSEFKTTLKYNISQVEFTGRICGKSTISDLLDTSNFTLGELNRLTDSLCALSQDDIMKVTDRLIPEMNIGSFLQGVLDLSPTYLLQSNNLTKLETMQFVENLAPLQKSFGNLLGSVKDLSEQATPEKTNKTSKGGLGGVLDMARTYGKALCGTEEAFDLGNYGVSVLISEDEQESTFPEPDWTERQLREMNEFNSTFCVNIYRSLHRIPGVGNFVWTILKPLTRGTVLYAPDNAATRAIMQEAWWLFDAVKGVQKTAKDWDSLKAGLQSVSTNTSSQLNISGVDTLDIVKTITTPVVSSTIRQTTGFSGQEIITKLPELKGFEDEDLNRLDVVAELLYNISTCLNYTLVPMSNARELEEYATTLMADNSLLAGIIFRDFENWRPKRQAKSKIKLPEHITYDIRMGVDHTVIPGDLFDRVRTPGPIDDYLDSYRYMRAFLPLQDLIDHAIIKIHTDGNYTVPATYTQAFPYPCYQIDDFMTWSSFVIVIILLFSWLCMMAVGITNAVSEKESGVEDTMTVMGMKGSMNRLAWFVNTFLGMIFLSAFVTMLISLGNLIRFSDSSLIFCWLVGYSWSIVMLCYFVSAIIHRTNLAALFGLLLYIILCMPFIILHTMDIVFSLSQKNKILMSLSVTSAFCFGANELITFEQNGQGIRWSSAFRPIGETFPFAWSCIMTVIDGVIYGIIAWYISNKFPGQHGIPQPWYFPLSPYYWGLKTTEPVRESKHPQEKKSRPINNGVPPLLDWLKGRTSHQMAHSTLAAPGEDEPNNLDVGISLHELTKVYKEGKKKAVDALTVNFYEGQITAFLGHNGAGKSTCIHMLTGLTQTSGGTAYIGGYDINGGLDEVRKSLGYCPQHDVLFDYMNIQEHFYFYSRMKGIDNRADAKKEVERMLELTDLSRFKHVPVNQLSGGQRRRVSVGMAFIGGSKVIILDEPTSGVDPAARRKIWEIIVKHRENRTIVLCTHHLDEADILGDRIVIVHQGKLVCSGSSLWLKTQYGSGYHLTLSKSIPTKEKDKGDRKRGWNTNKVLRFIKEKVPRARLVEEIGTEVTIVLPTNRGQSKRFKSLFAKLDAERSKLGIDKYGVANSTLEEVFLKVTKRAEQGKSLNPDRLRAWVLKGSGDNASLAESMAESYIPEHVHSDGASDDDSLNTSEGSSSNRSTSSTSTSRTGRSASGYSRSSRSSLDTMMTSESDSSYSGNSSSTSYKGSKDDDTLINVDGFNMSSSYRIRGVSLKLLQFKALLYKRFHHNRRDLRSHVSQVVLPAIFVMIAMFSGLFRPKPGYIAPHQLDASIYGPNSEIFYRIDHSTPLATEMEKSYLYLPGIGTACMPKNPLLNQSDCLDGNQLVFQEPLIGENLKRLYADPPKCLCSFGSQTCPVGAAGRPPPKLITPSKDRLYNLTSHHLNTSQFLLKTFDQFKNYKTGGQFGGWTFDVKKRQTTATVWFNNKGLHALPTYYNALNNMVLRANIQMKQSDPAFKDAVPEKYGITVYNQPFNATEWPLSRNGLLMSFSDTGVALTILIAYCFVPASYIVYVINERIRQEKRLQFICGVGTTLYWFSALLWDMLTYCMTVGLTVIIAASFNQPVYTARLNLVTLATMLVLFGWATIPLMYLLSRWFTNPTVGYVAAFIINLCIGINTTACIFFLSTPIFNGLEYIVLARMVLTRAFLIFPQFCLGDSLVKLAYNQIITNILGGLGVDFYISPFSEDMLFYHFLTMGVEGALFFGIHLIVEFKVCSTRKRAKRPADYREDGDVGLERQRVVTGGANNGLLTLYNLTKFYRRRFQKILAVDNLCIGVPRGECFGLLGVNGAGKTTSFKMITGEIRPSSGAAILNQKVISEDVSQMDQNVGYCPQFDALDDYLTGKEMVYYYSRLKGIPEAEIPPILHSIISKFKLQQYIGNTVRTYSAGNKRKLSTALALLGDPDLVLLDEPTTGMDPGTRRLVWNNILKVVKDKRSVILTSHSMEECDALCTRMAIMVNGNFMCLGSSQHLKNKFGTGYTVTARVGGRKPNLRRVKEFMRRNFPGTRLKDQHLSNLEFGVPSRGCTLAHLFGRLEEEKRHLNIENYSVSQTTLDQVFLSFARLQGDGRMGPIPRMSAAYDDLSEVSETPETVSDADSIGTAGSLRWSEPPATERGAPPSYHTGGIAPNSYDNPRILPALDNVTALHVGPDSDITLHHPPPGISPGSLILDAADFPDDLDIDLGDGNANHASGSRSGSGSGTVPNSTPSDRVSNATTTTDSLA